MGIPFLRRWLGASIKSGNRLAEDGTCKGAAPVPDRTIASDAESQFNLGLKFAGTDGGPRDYAQALDWYLKAARQGHGAAQFNVAMMCGSGQGMLRDDNKALSWMRRAAQSGHAGAQYHLGVRQHRAGKANQAQDASECRVEAYKWLKLAHAQGYHQSASALEFVALRMTRGEVVEAMKRAKEFVAAESVDPA